MLKLERNIKNKEKALTAELKKLKKSVKKPKKTVKKVIPEVVPDMMPQHVQRAYVRASNYGVGIAEGSIDPSVALTPEQLRRAREAIEPSSSSEPNLEAVIHEITSRAQAAASPNPTAPYFPCSCENCTQVRRQEAEERRAQQGTTE